MSATVETEKLGCNVSRHQKGTREGRRRYPHIVQGKHASMSSPSLTSEIFVNKRERTHQECTIQIHWQHWANRTENEDKQTIEKSKRNTTNRQTKNQKETQHRKKR